MDTAKTPMQQVTGKFFDVVAKVKVEGFHAISHGLPSCIYAILHRICTGGPLAYTCPMSRMMFSEFISESACRNFGRVGEIDSFLCQ